MAKHGKKYRAAAEKVEQRPYQLDEAFALLKQIASAKFNETVELSMLLGVDPKHADQMVRGTTVLPHGTGQTKRVLVIAQGDKQREAAGQRGERVERRLGGLTDCVEDSLCRVGGVEDGPIDEHVQRVSGCGRPRPVRRAALDE